MTDLRTFHQGDPVRHRAGGWTGIALYTMRARGDGPAYVRVRWSDGYAATTERQDDLLFDEKDVT